MSFVVRGILFASLLLLSHAAPCLAQSSVTGSLLNIGQSEHTISLTQFPAGPTWQTQQGPIDVSRIVRFGNPSLIKEDSVVVLDDGSFFAAKELRSEGVSLLAYNRLWDDMQIPLRPIRGILLRAHLDPDHTRQSLDRILSYEGTRDRLRMSNGDYIDGTFRRLDPLKVEFQVGEKSMEIDRKRIDEIHFARSAGKQPIPPQGLWVGLQDGSMFLCVDTSFQNERLTLTTASGFTLRSTPLDNAYRWITYVRPLGTDVRYLSDLEAIGFKSLGFLAPSWPYHKDRNIHEGTLKSGGYVSQKGLGLHATSRLAYRVEENDARFKAKIGIDDDTDGSGSVVFKVYASETGNQWKTIYESPIVRGGEAPRDVDVPIKGMKGIALVVEFADGADVLDHANWMDARFESD